MTRHVGTADEVVVAFLEGRSLRTPLTGVPGGCRVSTDGTDLYSYRTAIAARHLDGRVALTSRGYSVTTSKLMRHLRGALRTRGYRPDVDAEPEVHAAAVPGRWGGYGPAWHPTGWESVPFIVYTDDPDNLARYDAAERERWAAEGMARAVKLAAREARAAAKLAAKGEPLWPTP